MDIREGEQKQSDPSRQYSDPGEISPGQAGRREQVGRFCKKT
jgi:hypothetical protein